MLTNDKVYLESKNFIDKIDFTRNDPCIFVVYPAGASGDLVSSIIDKHYIRTGCEYYGISDTGKVHFYSTDYKIINQSTSFDDQWFYNLADKLGERNLNYSLLDQVMFACHQNSPMQITNIINTFPQARIINIYPTSKIEKSIMEFQSARKNHNQHLELDVNITGPIALELIDHPRVLNMPFYSLFNEEKFENMYSKIIKFLDLDGKLIRYDYIKYYVSKQADEVKRALQQLDLVDYN